MTDRYHEKLDGIVTRIDVAMFIGVFVLIFLIFSNVMAWRNAGRAADYAEALCRETGGHYCNSRLVRNRKHPVGK